MKKRKVFSPLIVMVAVTIALVLTFAVTATTLTTAGTAGLTANIDNTTNDDGAIVAQTADTQVFATAEYNNHHYGANGTAEEIFVYTQKGTTNVGHDEGQRIALTRQSGADSANYAGYISRKIC